MPEQLHGCVEQQQAEQQEHEREQRQQRRTERDEDRPHHQRQHDAEGQHLVLVLLRYGERGHDDHEHEQVVDRQALLDDVAGEVLRPELAAVRAQEPQAEPDRHQDVEDRPGGGLAEPDPVRPERGDQQVGGQQDDDRADGDGPGDGTDLEHALLQLLRATICDRA